jgi:DNA-binding MarR family transcriptional regulator
MKIDKSVTQIRAASREMVRQLGLLNNCFSAIGSTSQCHALVEIDTQGKMNLGQLSAALNLEKSTTSRLIMQLYEKGICHIQPDENDLRNKLISLTKKGVALVNKIHTEAKSQVEEALNLMTEEERDMVVHGLSIYAKALKQAKLDNEEKFRKVPKRNIPKDTP